MNKTILAISISSLFILQTNAYAENLTNQNGIYTYQEFDQTLSEPGQYESIDIDITSENDQHGISLYGSSSDTNEKVIESEGIINVDVQARQSIGIEIYDGAQGAASLVGHNGLTINASSDQSYAFGIIQTTAYGFGLGPDGKPNGGKVRITGPISITATGETRAGGILAGSWFGNSASENDSSTMILGSEGSQNIISVHAGNKITPSSSDDPYEYAGEDKVVGILGYATGDGKSELTLYGSTNIKVSSDRTNDRGDIDQAIYGIQAAQKSEMHFIDEDGSLDIYAESTQVSRKIFGIVAGLYDAAYGKTGEERSSIEVLQKTTNITFTNASYAQGVASYGGSNITLDTNLTINAGNATTFYGLIAGRYSPDENPNPKPQNTEGGSIHLTGSFNTILPEDAKISKNTYTAIAANGSTNYSKEPLPTVIVDSTGATSQINGNVIASYGGKVDLTLDGGESFLKGHVDQRYSSLSGNWGNILNFAGQIDLTLKNGATWLNLDYQGSNNLGNYFCDGISALNSLKMQNGVLDMHSMPIEGLQRSNYQQILMKSLIGSGEQSGRLILDMNLVSEGEDEWALDEQYVNYSKLAMDRISIDGSATGTYLVDLHFVGGLDGLDPEKMHSLNWFVGQGEDSDLTLTGVNGQNAVWVNGGVSTWAYAFVAQGDEAKLETEQGRLELTNHGVGTGHWYLIRKQNETPPEIDQNITIGTSTGPALAYMADLEDLRKRIGEVRYGAQDGLWAKAFAKQDSVNGHHSRGFEQEAYGINIGFDKLVGTDETSSWLIGAAFRYGTADQEGLGVAGSATGELDEYSVKAYATWMHKSGSYADFVLQAGRYDQELKGLDNTGTGSTHADYNTWGYGASIEIGHMFTIANAEDDRPWFNHWFIEPQFELSYFRAQGANYRTSTGMKVEQDDADFLTGRAGLVIGKKFNYGTVNDLDKRYFQAALIGGVKHEFLGGDQTIHYTGVDNVNLSAKADDIAGTRVYYGVNMDWQLAQNLRLFGEVSREEGDGYTKDYDVSIGLKYSF